VVGYARVSTGHQLLEGQRDALAEVSCEWIFTDQLSGVRENRPGLVELLGYGTSGPGTPWWLSRWTGRGVRCPG